MLLPGLLRGGTTLVISPLIALMEDQASAQHRTRPAMEAAALNPTPGLNGPPAICVDFHSSTCVVFPRLFILRNPVPDYRKVSHDNRVFTSQKHLVGSHWFARDGATFPSAVSLHTSRHPGVQLYLVCWYQWRGGDRARVADLTGQAFFLFVALALYYLLKGVSQRHALLMLILIAVSIPIAFANELNSVAALTLARGPDFLLTFSEPQRIALMRLFLNLRGAGFDVAGIFWGLWLFPLGWLVYRSGFIPRILGILLMVGCFAYLANSITSLALPQYEDAVSRWMSPIQLVEMVFMLWLLIMGAQPKSVPE